MAARAESNLSLLKNAVTNPITAIRTEAAIAVSAFLRYSSRSDGVLQFNKIEPAANTSITYHNIIITMPFSCPLSKAGAGFIQTHEKAAIAAIIKILMRDISLYAPIILFSRPVGGNGFTNKPFHQCPGVSGLKH
jgi:hypothetical protein